MGGRGGNSDGNQRRVSSRRVPGLPQLGDEGKPRRLSEEAARLQESRDMYDEEAVRELYAPILSDIENLRADVDGVFRNKQFSKINIDSRVKTLRDRIKQEENKVGNATLDREYLKELREEIKKITEKVRKSELG